MNIDITTLYAVGNITLYGIALLPFIVLLVGFAKGLGFPVKFAPHLAGGLGIIGGILVAVTTGQPIIWGIMVGIILGAAASGNYSQGKSTTDTTLSIASSGVTELITVEDTLVNKFKDAVIEAIQKTTSGSDDQEDQE